MLIRVAKVWQVPLVKGFLWLTVEFSAAICALTYLKALRRGAVVYVTKTGEVYAAEDGPQTEGDRIILWAEALHKIREARDEVRRNNALIQAAAEVLRARGEKGPIVLAFPDPARDAPCDAAGRNLAN